MIIHTFPDTLAAARAAALRMAALAVEAVQARGRFTVALSGGHSPWRMLEALATLDVPWSGVHVFQVDERVAPAGDPDRNATHIAESLLSRAPIAREQVHLMPVEAPDLAAAAGRYAETLAGHRGHAARPRPGRTWASAPTATPPPSCRAIPCSTSPTPTSPSPARTRAIAG